MKFINWLILFAIAPLAAIRPFEIVRKRKAFAQKLDSTSTLGDKVSVNEATRNRIFLALQENMKSTLLISEKEQIWKTAIMRFKKTAKEEIE